MNIAQTMFIARSFTDEIGHLLFRKPSRSTGVQLERCLSSNFNNRKASLSVNNGFVNGLGRIASVKHLQLN